MNRTAPLLIATATTAAALLAAAPSNAATVPSCAGASIAVHATRTNGATGHGSLVLLFENVGSHTCTLRGYPGTDALGRHGHVLAHARRTVSGFAGGSSGGVRTIRIRPGHFSSATLEWFNFNPRTSGPCRFSYAIAVTPPNTTATVHRRRSVSVCDLQIHPVVAGRSGRS